MSSIVDAFSNMTFEEQYKALEQAKNDAETKKGQICYLILLAFLFLK
jgi:hypothetical protein